MEWKTYEETVRNIYQTLGKDFGVTIECYGSGCKRRGKSGAEHQIDVLTIQWNGVHKYFTAIECKYWKDKVNKDIVMKTVNIIEDCNIEKGIIVSKVGFTPDAISFAKYKNVQLVELKEKVYQEDGKSFKYFWNNEVAQAILASLTFFPNDKLIKKYIKEGLLSDYYFEFSDGNKLSLQDAKNNFLNNKVLNGDPLNIITDEVIFPCNTNFKSQYFKEKLIVEKIILKGFVKKYTKLDSDYLENKVYLIMKAIFENKNYTITANWEIEEEKVFPLQMTTGEQLRFDVKIIKREVKLVTANLE